jgi:Xaa-Pro aminopeptidase
MGLGGVRIEDVALVTRRGSRNLTRVPKQLEI